MGHVGFGAIGRSEIFSQGDDKFDPARPLKSVGMLLLTGSLAQWWRV